MSPGIPLEKTRWFEIVERAIEWFKVKMEIEVLGKRWQIGYISEILLSCADENSVSFTMFGIVRSDVEHEHIQIMVRHIWSGVNLPR